MLSPSLSSNLIKLPLIQAIRWFLLGLPIAVLFYQENGVNLSQVFWIQAFFSLIILLIEVPSGWFADRFSYKKSMFFGAIFICLGDLVYVFADQFVLFLLAVFLLAIGTSLISGCDSALLYDTLLELKQEDRYIHWDSKMSQAAYYSEGFAGLIGGGLALLSLRAPYIAQAIIIIMILPLILSLKEPTQNKEQKQPSSILDTIRYLFSQPMLLSIMLFFAWLNAAGITFVWQIQSYLQALNWPLAYFGITWAILQFSTGFFSNYTQQFSKLFSLKQSLFCFFACTTGAYLALSYNSSAYGLILFFIFFFNRAMMGPISRNAINHLISGNQRATILSIKNLFMRLFFCSIGPYIGSIVDHKNSNEAFLQCFYIFGIGGLILLLITVKSINKKPQSNLTPSEN